MSKLRIITSSQMCRLLESIGFKAIRQKGSHRFFQHIDGRTAFCTVGAMLTRIYDKLWKPRFLLGTRASIPHFSRRRGRTARALRNGQTYQ